MLAPDNWQNERVQPVDPADITTGELLAHISRHGEKPIVFTYDGRLTRPGFHVTEVKSAQFAALDCEANPERWTEIFVQLWDVAEAGHCLTAGKFAAIIRKVTEHVALDDSARLTFEVSDGMAAMQLHRAALPDVTGDVVRVALSPRPASCKPRDRWLAQQEKAAACCGTTPAPQGKACCGS